ncbi:MAG: hypothetical protein IJ744_04840 [Lachnospiraceae bacterium]|nr:hypothetical protein [Lachnospiraceae bacterium]
MLANQNEQPSTSEVDNSTLLSTDTDTSDFASLTVLQEVESLRDVREKHYRLSDGSFAAVYYDEPVQFEAADGSFHQIDNTIKENTRDNKKIYSATAGELTKEFASSLQDGSLFSMEYQKYQISLSALTKTDVIDSKESEADALEEEAKPDETDFAEETEVPEATEEEVAVEAETSEEESITDVSPEPITVTEGDEDTKPEEGSLLSSIGFSFLRNDSVLAKVDPSDMKPLIISDKGLSIEDAGEIAHYNTSVTYPEVFPGVSYLYQNHGYTVKETIVLENADTTSFSFLLSGKDITAKLEEGDVDIYSSSGELIYHIPAPYMYDADGAESYDVAYDLIPVDEENYILTIAADEKWLNDPERVYPVYIDPTIEASALVVDGGMVAGWVAQGSPTTAKGRQSSLYVGYSTVSTTHECYAYIGCSSMPTLPDSATIAYAALRLYQNSFSTYYGTSYLEWVGAYQVRKTVSSHDYS